MNQDDQAKERARPKRTGERRPPPASAAAQQADSQGPDRSTSEVPARPSAEKAVAHLDKKIAEQRKDYSRTSEEAAKADSRRTSNSGVRREPPPILATTTSSGRVGLSQMEADAAAKARACRSSTANFGASSPGVRRVPAPNLAASVSSASSSSGRVGLSQMESDAAAKARARGNLTSQSGGASSGVRRMALSRLTQLERDAQAKARAAGSSGQSPDAFPSQSLQRLGQLEADVTAKARSTSPHSSGPGAYFERSAQNEMNQLEDDVTAKLVALGGSSTTRTGTSGLDQLENDIMAKARARPNSGTSGLRALEDAEAKLRASNRPNNVPNPGAHEELNRMEDAIMRKARQSSSDAAPSQLLGLEADMTAKENARRGTSLGMYRPSPGQLPSSEIARLDQRIAQKTGVAPRQEQEPQDVNPIQEDEEEMPFDDSDGKLTMKGEILGSVMHDNLKEETPDVVAAIEQSYKAEGSEEDEAQPGELRTVTVSSDSEYGEEGSGELAVAVAVKDDDDDMYIPAAVEYDPDAKPPLHRNRRFRLYGAMIFILGLVVIIGVVVVMVTQRDTDGNEDSEPTFAPTSYRESLGIQSQLERVVGREKLSDETTPHYRAMQWILHEDPVQLGPEDVNLIQRYLLAFFYFQTSQDGPWRSCNPPEEGGEDFCLYQKLVSVDPEMTYTGSPWIRWLGTYHECHWAGVFCDEFNQTRKIEVNGQGLSGTLPLELTHFPFLQSIALSWNRFTGTLPSEYGSMKHILNLEFHYNDLTGTVPSSWWNGRNVQRLNLGDNMFTGTIPADITGLSDIKGLFMNDNLFTGTLPTEIGQVSSLGYARWQRNSLSGQLPTELGNLLEAKELWFHRLPLEGTLPSELGKLTEMRDIRMQFTNIGGTIPEEFYNCRKFTRFDLYDMKLEGTLSSQIAQMTQLRILRMRNNELSGQIPSELGRTESLRQLWLHGNNFTGEVPEEICDNVDPETLSEVMADCSVSEFTGVAAVECPLGCCTACCDKDTGICDAFE